jgi:hypothetical protein
VPASSPAYSAVTKPGTYPPFAPTLPLLLPLRLLLLLLPPRFAQKYVRFNMNSGLFYIKSNPRTIELMQRLETRLAREKYWDQTAYNEEMFFLSHDEYKSPQVGGGRPG